MYPPPPLAILLVITKAVTLKWGVVGFTQHLKSVAELQNGSLPDKVLTAKTTKIKRVKPEPTTVSTSKTNATTKSKTKRSTSARGV